jgi:hypothetical protein
MGNVSSPTISEFHHCSHQLSPIINHARGISTNSITIRDYNPRSDTTPISKSPSPQKWINGGDFTCSYPHDSWYLLVESKLPPHSMSTVGSKLKSTRRQHYQPASIGGRKIIQRSHISSNESIVLGFYITEPRHH